MKTLTLHFLLFLFIFLPSRVYGSDFNSFANSTYRQHPNSLTVHIIPSTYRIDWSTTRNLFWSLVKNQYFFPKTKSTIGHVSLELNCQRPRQQAVRRISGQTVNSLNAFREKVAQGYGFSILNRPKLYSDLPYVTVDGKLDTPASLFTRFDKLIEKDNFATLSFLIDPEQCHRVVDFIDEYTQRTKEGKLAGNRYGFGADPRSFTGAGCATFVQTALEIAGLSDYAQMMERTVHVQEKEIGVPDLGKKVSFWSVFFDNSNLTQETPQTRMFLFPDPQNLFDLVQNPSSINKESFVERRPILKSQTYYLLVNAIKDKAKKQTSYTNH